MKLNVLSHHDLSIIVIGLIWKKFYIKIIELNNMAKDVVRKVNILCNEVKAYTFTGFSTRKYFVIIKIYNKSLSWANINYTFAGGFISCVIATQSRIIRFPLEVTYFVMTFPFCTFLDKTTEIK